MVGPHERKVKTCTAQAQVGAQNNRCDGAQTSDVSVPCNPDCAAHHFRICYFGSRPKFRWVRPKSFCLWFSRTARLDALCAGFFAQKLASGPLCSTVANDVDWLMAKQVDSSDSCSARWLGQWGLPSQRAGSEGESEQPNCCLVVHVRQDSAHSGDDGVSLRARRQKLVKGPCCCYCG